MKLTSGRIFAVGALTLAVAAGCKPRMESLSGLRDNSGLTITETMTAGGGGVIDGNGKRVNYVQIDVAKAGIITLDISLYSGTNGGFTQPVDIRIYDQPNQTTPIASGSLAAGQQWMSGNATIGVKQAGPIFVLVDHKGQLDNANANGDIWSQVIESTPAQSNIINFPGYLATSEVLTGNSINLKLAVPQTLAQLNANLTVHAASDKVTDTSRPQPQQPSFCSNCTATMILTENNKDYQVPLTFNNNYVSGSALFKLAAGTYDVKFDLKGLAAGSAVQVNVESDYYRGNSGNPFVPGAAMGLMNLTFDQDNSKKAIHGGKRFGYYVESDRSSETRIDLSLSVDRIMNATDADKFPTSISAVLGGPGGGYSNVVADTTLPRQGNNQFNGTVITDVNKGKYRLTIDGSNLEKTDILNLSGSMAVSNLSIPDGGPDFSTFQDLGTVTITPPNNYLVDLNVQSQPHTPAAAPLDLASKSVLEGMEMIRKEFHVRLPKGAQRGPRNTIDSGTIEACLGNPAEHWSDLMIHYYCQYGQARSCYTGTIRTKAQGIGGDTTLTQQQKIAKAQKIRLETYAECAATAQTDDEWKWLVENQGDVFQYVMNSQTFAFNDEQQQAVINKFYRINDPSDKEECKTKRPRRAIDPTDGTHCQSKKIYNPAMTSVGR